MVCGRLPGGQEITWTTQTGIPHQKAEQGAGARESCEQTQQNTNAQGRRKALDQSGAQKEESRS